MLSRMLRSPKLAPLSRQAAPPLSSRLVVPSSSRLVHTEARIQELGHTLPTMPAPLASYTTCVRSGNLLFLAGHVPFTPDMSSLVPPGKVGVDYSVEEAHALAHFIGLELISTIKGNVGDLDKVRKIVKVVGFVNCPDSFGDQPEVLNGCSDLMEQVFGRERGVHARSAVGTNSLPRQMPVEIEMIVEVDD